MYLNLDGLCFFFLRHPCLPLTLPPSWPGARMPFQAKPEKKSRHPKVVGVVDGIRENISQPGTIFLCTCHYLTKKEFIIVSPKDHTSSWWRRQLLCLNWTMHHLISPACFLISNKYIPSITAVQGCQILCKLDDRTLRVPEENAD